MASGESLVPISAFFSPRLVTDFGIRSQASGRRIGRTHVRESWSTPKRIPPESSGRRAGVSDR